MIQIGRLTDLGNPSGIAFDGRTLKLQGWLSGATREYVSAIRDTLLGYNNNPDEPAIPIIWEDDPYIDGMYRDIQFSATPMPGVSEHGGFHVQYSLDATLVSRQVQVEAVTVGGFRTNETGTAYDTAAEVTPFYCVPASSYDYYGGTGTGAWFLGTATRTTATGDVSFIPFASPSAVARRVPTYSMALGDWYTGSAVVERTDGLSAIPVGGRNMPAGLSATQGWRIGNGLIRLSESDVADTTFNVEMFDGTNWNMLGWSFGSGGFYLQTLKAVSVLRNSPECCVMRFSATLHGGYDYAALIDVRIVRGSRFAEIRMGSIPNVVTTWGAQVFGLGATILTSGGNQYGMVQTTATSGMKYYAFSDVLTTASLDANAAAASWSIAIGQQLVANAAVTYESLGDLLTQYYGPVSSRQRVVER